MQKSLGLSILLIMVVLILPVACKAPAEFQVNSLDVMPPEVNVGESVSVTAEIKNVGGSEGAYNAILTVDGVQVETKNVVVAPGATETVTFSLTKDNPGNYQIGIGGLTSSLAVKPKLVAKEFELKYDDGEARDCLSSCGGYLIDFIPPALPFTLNKALIYGVIKGQPKSQNFEIEVWDKDSKMLTNIKLPITKFDSESASWVEIELPNLEVNGKFFIHVYTGTCRREGIHIGADDSIKNEHSICTIRSGNVIKENDWASLYPPNSWYGDKSKVNWMIRVIGTALVPEG